MKVWLPLFLVAAATAGGWWYLKGDGDTQPQYQTATVMRGELTQLVTATGTLNPVVNVQVGSQISGNIQKLFADYNSSVKAGQVVAQLDPAIYQAIVHQTEGDLANAQATLELAKITANRKKDLVAQHAAPQADLDNATAALHQAEAIVKVKTANLEKAKVDLDHCTIYSPIDGTVISRSVDVGQTVAAAMNAPVLFTVANDLTKMQIDSNVAEADVGVIELGQKVDFSVDAFPYRTFHGEVAQIRNAATTVQNVVTYDVVIAVNNEDLKLKPGMTANVSVIVAHRDDALKLPNAALRFRPPETQQTAAASPAPQAGGAPGGAPQPGGAQAGGPQGGGGPGGGPGRRGGRGAGGGGGRAGGMRPIYTLANGSQLQPVQAKLGISDGVTTEVLEGLKEGDVVVTGLNSAPASTTAAKPTNPLGGGMRFR